MWTRSSSSKKALIILINTVNFTNNQWPVRLNLDISVIESAFLLSLEYSIDFLTQTGRWTTVVSDSHPHRKSLILFY